MAWEPCTVNLMTIALTTSSLKDGPKATQPMQIETFRDLGAGG
jgi:hypothetical protein